MSASTMAHEQSSSAAIAHVRMIANFSNFFGVGFMGWRMEVAAYEGFGHRNANSRGVFSRIRGSCPATIRKTLATIRIDCKIRRRRTLTFDHLAAFFNGG